MGSIEAVLLIPLSLLHPQMILDYLLSTNIERREPSHALKVVDFQTELFATVQVVDKTLIGLVPFRTTQCIYFKSQIKEKGGTHASGLPRLMR